MDHRLSASLEDPAVKASPYLGVLQQRSDRCLVHRTSYPVAML